MDKSLHCIFYMNESRVYSRDPELKCNNAEWQSPSHCVWTQHFAFRVLWLMHIIFLIYYLFVIDCSVPCQSSHVNYYYLILKQLFQLPCLLSSSISFLAFLFCVVLGGSKSKIALFWQRNPSLTWDKPTSISTVSFALPLVSHIHTMYQHWSQNNEWCCTKLSHYNVHMRCCTKCKHKTLSSKHKFPVLYMPDIYFLLLETTSTRKKTLWIQKRHWCLYLV